MQRVLIPSGCRRTRLRNDENFAPQQAVRLLPFLLLLSAMQLHAQAAADSLHAFPQAATQATAPGTHESEPDDISRSIAMERESTRLVPDLSGSLRDRQSGSSQAGAVLNFENSCQQRSCAAGFDAHSNPSSSPFPEAALPPPASPDDSTENSKATSPVFAQRHERPDSNLDIYYRNRLEFGLDVGWHPVNIPFVYDFAVGDAYNMTPLKYTLVPIIASLRWHVTNVGWRSVFRGNMDFTFSGSITPIPRGPETHYYSFMFGIRRNFVYRNWKAVPFFEERGGAGMIDAKEPLGVLWAQGQNLTFTYNMGAGLRYNLNSKYSFSAGMNYMHISNAYLSEPAFKNYGINVYGPMFGMDVRLGKPHHHASE